MKSWSWLLFPIRPRPISDFTQPDGGRVHGCHSDLLARFQIHGGIRCKIGRLEADRLVLNRPNRSTGSRALSWAPGPVIVKRSVPFLPFPASSDTSLERRPLGGTAHPSHGKGVAAAFGTVIGQPAQGDYLVADIDHGDSGIPTFDGDGHRHQERDRLGNDIVQGQDGKHEGRSQSD